MKKYMVITVFEGEEHARFFDDSEKAHQYFMDAECGVGANVEMYIREEPTEENDYYEGYSLFYC